MFTPAEATGDRWANDAAGGLCHNFAESSYTDNMGQITITIPDRMGKTGGSIKTAEDGIDDENRPTS